MMTGVGADNENFVDATEVFVKLTRRHQAGERAAEAMAWRWTTAAVERPVARRGRQLQPAALTSMRHGGAITEMGAQVQSDLASGMMFVTELHDPLKKQVEIDGLGHGAIAGIVGMQVVAGIVRRLQPRRMSGVAQHRVKVEEESAQPRRKTRSQSREELPQFS
jgi:hypothetical protein